MILLFLLNMSEGIAKDGRRKLEGRGVINRRNVLLHRKRVLTEIGVILLCAFGAGGGSASELCILGGGCGGGHSYLTAREHLIYCVEVLLFILLKASEKILKLGVASRLCILSVLFNAKLLLGFEIV